MQKLTEEDEAKAGVLQFADHIMEALLHVFACRKGTVHEEAMLAVVSGGRRAVGRGGGGVVMMCCGAGGLCVRTMREWQGACVPGPGSGRDVSFG